ncbi:unnamed protein product [Cylindrotheca closterium]|uniref:Uncharacterized protein n=1 Tax=Cylindrotheca closterium TaxID=2856 RepID=A0AAD2CV33_9STRA|nr:unnamed protein product [Cylindrotheca closterium]
MTLYEGKYIAVPNDNTHFKSRFDNFGTWLKYVGIRLPNPFTEVCYGGNFAIKLSRARKLTNELHAMESSLRRGDNIEEGHFAERAWAGIFSKPLSEEQQLRLKSIKIDLFSSKESAKSGGTIPVP